MRVTTLRTRLAVENAAQILADYDVVVEATDNFESKFLINDVCLELKKPFTTAGILALSGQAMFVVPGKTPCLRCLTPEMPHGVPTTAQQGVLGTVPGILGSVQAMEVIRWLAGLWRPGLDGTGWLHSIEGDRMRLRTLRIARRKDCTCASLWDTR